MKINYIAVPRFKGQALPPLHLVMAEGIHKGEDEDKFQELFRTAGYDLWQTDCKHWQDLQSLRLALSERKVITIVGTQLLENGVSFHLKLA